MSMYIYICVWVWVFLQNQFTEVELQAIEYLIFVRSTICSQKRPFPVYIPPTSLRVQFPPKVDTSFKNTFSVLNFLC